MNVVPKDNRMNAAIHEWPGWLQGWVYSCVDYSCGCRERGVGLWGEGQENGLLRGGRA